MKVFIPNSAFLRNIDSFITKIDLTNPVQLQISTHPNYLAVHPLVISMIAALGANVKPENIICDDIRAPSGHYLSRMGLFKMLGINPKVKSIVEHEAAGRMIPLVQIKTSNDLDRFLKELVPLLHLGRDPKHGHAIQHIFSELIRNVLEHAQSRYGAFVCAQYFRNSNRISIGVADTGAGLKKTISQSHVAKDDQRAIQLALTPGVTGTTNKPGGTAQNAGLGLFLIKSIAYINSDFFTILSGSSMYKLLKKNHDLEIQLKGDPLEEAHKVTKVPNWTGTAVGVDISLNQTEQFDALLDAIYRFYANEVKSQKRLYYKKPKFI